jgi:sec-independent protein translocase protein TatA
MPYNGVQMKNLFALSAWRSEKASNIMFGFHAWDLLIVLLIVILIFGASRLPQLGSSLGKSISLFQKNLHEDQPPAIDEPKEGEQAERPETASISEKDR